MAVTNWHCIHQHPLVASLFLQEVELHYLDETQKSVVLELSTGAWKIYSIVMQHKSWHAFA
jgi:hypothetical protein